MKHLSIHGLPLEGCGSIYHTANQWVVYHVVTQAHDVVITYVLYVMLAFQRFAVLALQIAMFYGTMDTYHTYNRCSV